MIKFQVIDADYIVTDSKPIIRFFGKTEDNKSICVFFEKFLPYFYVLPKDGKEAEIKNILIKNFKDLVLRIESVEKLLPIGYHKEPTKLLKITLNDPRKTPLIREDLKK